MRVDQITFTRFLAAISIVIYHFGQQSFFYNNVITGVLLKHANIGVSYFFVLSGFVMILAYKSLHVNPLKYYINRFARVYPVLFFSLLLLLFIKIILSKHIDITQLALSIFCLQAWVDGYALTLNGPAWSLSVEFFFYALFPLLLLSYEKIPLLKITVYALLFWLVSQFVFHLLFYNNYAINYFFYNPLLHLNEFVVGNLAGLIFVSKKQMLDNVVIKLSFGLTPVIIFLLVIIYLLLYFSLPVNYHNGLLAVLFAFLIIALSLDKGIISNLFGTKVFVFLGEISYSIYILQLPVKSLTDIVSKILKLNFGFTGYLVILIISSSLTYLIIEKPVRSFIISYYQNRFVQ